MAAYTVAVGDTGKYEKTLAANVEDTVTFGGGPGDATITDLSEVEILHHSGASPIYVRMGGSVDLTTPDNCYIVLPGTAVIVEPSTSGDTTVHIKSAATAVYSVANGG